MLLIKKIIRYLSDSGYRFNINAGLGIYNKMDDEAFLKNIFKIGFGKELNLDNPQTFNEKLQWLKLYDRKPEYTMMVDKFQARNYIADKIGEEYLIPCLGVWDDPDDIDFDKLPNQFVLKCNHNSGLGMCICKDKSKLNIAKVRRELRKGLKQDYYLTGREWAYKDVPRKIICEKYMSDENEGSSLIDYKFMCFNGKVKCSFVCSGRFSSEGLRVTFFDRDWNVMPFERHYHSVKEGLPKPHNYEKMVEIAEKLSKGIPFVRIDFYEVKSKIYFGEFTFYPGSGMEEFNPEEWDKILGSWIDLPKKKGN